MWRHYRPGGALAPFVDLLWYYRGEAPPHKLERLLPTGEMDLVVNLHQDSCRTYGRDDLREARCFGGSVLVGAHSEYFILDTQAQEHVIGAHFRPGGGYPFFPAPAGEFRDRHVGLRDLWGNAAVELRDRLLEEPTVGRRFAILEAFLLAQARRPLDPHPAVCYALREFRRTQDVAEVRGQTGLSARGFIEAFTKRVGLTPKLFCRVRRFQKLIAEAHAARELDWAATALDCGYFDQAHFIHDFRSFAGMSPSEYVGRRFRHPNHVPMV